MNAPPTSCILWPCWRLSGMLHPWPEHACLLPASQQLAVKRLRLVTRLDADIAVDLEKCRMPAGTLLNKNMHSKFHIPPTMTVKLHVGARVLQGHARGLRWAQDGASGRLVLPGPCGPAAQGFCRREGFCPRTPQEAAQGFCPAPHTPSRGRCLATSAHACPGTQSTLRCGP